jgi:SSS family solute:Na+ symporter
VFVNLFNSVLNSSVTLFGIDIYKQHINPDAEEALVVKQGKRFGLFPAPAAMFIAPFIANAGSLFDYLQEINGIYSIPILTIIIVGYLTKRVPAIAAKIGLLSGSILSILSQFVLKPYFENKALDEAIGIGISDPARLLNIKVNAYFDLHFLDVMAILFALNVVIMLIIEKLKPRSEDYVQEYTKQVNITPWKYAKPVGIGVIIVVAGIYAYFR